jgi:MFS superfamily sulfate permease-like transporter
MRSIFGSLKNDIPAGIVVFLVALPLCLGIAVASGAPPLAGVIAGIAGGVVVSLLSNSALGVSGPAAGLTVIVLTAIGKLGFEPFLFAVVIAGLIQLILGFLKAGVIAYFFPSSVIKGMLAAIGVLIILKQIPHALGYDKDYEGDFTFLRINGENTFSDIYNSIAFISAGSLIITAISLAILIIWERPFIKRQSFLKMVPAPLLVVVAGVLLTLFFNKYYPGIAPRPDQLVVLPVAKDISSFFGQFSFPDFSQFANPQVYITAGTLAIVASIETLLCVEATDKLDPQKRMTSPNRELKAQGLGNIFSGLIGGLPLTQVIVRSSANIQSGGKTKMAAFIHGVLLLVAVIAFPAMINMIPYAALAAILLQVGYKLTKPSLIKSMAKLGLKQFLPFIVTIIAIIFTDLLTGIVIGMAVSFFFILRNNYKLPYYFHKEKHHSGEIIRIQLSEDVSFLNKASILLTLNHLPPDSRVIIDASRSIHIDHDVIEVITEFRENAKASNITLELVNMPDRETDIDPGLLVQSMNAELGSRRPKGSAAS